MAIVDPNKLSEQASEIVTAISSRVSSDQISRSISSTAESAAESLGNNLSIAYADVESTASGLASSAISNLSGISDAIGPVEQNLSDLSSDAGALNDQLNNTGLSELIRAGGTVIDDITETFDGSENLIQFISLNGLPPTFEVSDSDLTQLGSKVLTQSLSKKDPGKVTQGKLESVSDSKTTAVLPVNNVLHNYSSFTYRLSIHGLTVDDYNNLFKQKIRRYQAKNVIIASAGQYGEDFVRNPLFSEDFYFGNLSIDSIIGLNAGKRGSNAVNINFDLIEPYGVTLIDKIIALAEELGVSNYLELPYLLQIDFIGYTDDGSAEVVPNQTKYIPMQIASISTKINNKGTMYQISAYPYNHQAFKRSKITTPAQLVVNYDTVGTFFGAISPKQYLEQESNQSSYRAPPKETAPSKTSYIGLADALNSYYRKLKGDDKRAVPDEYEFVIDDEIANAKVASSSLNLTDTAEIKIGDTAAAAASASRCNPRVYEIETGIREFKIKPGESIIDIINYVVRNSDYILNQMPQYYIKQAKAAVRSNASTREVREILSSIKKKANSTLRWFKITSKVTLLGFDSKENMFGVKTTYFITPYRVNSLPETDVGPGVSKIYDYIYSGHNQDILNLDIDFNLLYYSGVTANKETIAEAFNDQKSTNFKKEPEPEVIQRSICPDPLQKDQRKIRSRMSPTISEGSSSYSPEQVQAADISDSLLNKLNGDMITLNLQIIGDPEFIKQDELFEPILNLDSFDRTSTGSIVQDNGEVYVQVNFVTPDDISPEHGLMKFNEKKMSAFSGIYRVTVINNKFSKGQFTQELTLVRVFNQNHCLRRVDYGPGVGPTFNGDSSHLKIDTLSGINPSDTMTEAEEFLGGAVISAYDTGKAIPAELNIAVRSDFQGSNAADLNNVSRAIRDSDVTSYIGEITDTVSDGVNSISEAITENNIDWEAFFDGSEVAPGFTLPNETPNSTDFTQ